MNFTKQNRYSPHSPFIMSYSQELVKKQASFSFKNFGVRKGDLIFPKDARTYIQHPAEKIIEPLVKNIDYDLAKYALKRKEGCSEEDFNLFAKEHMVHYGDSNTYSLLVKMLRLINPCQVQVETLVSNEALFSESKGFDDMADIPWDDCFHHKVIEFYFECPNLPTFIAYKGSLNKLMSDFKVKIRADEPWCNDESAIHFFSETPSGLTNYFCVDRESLPSLISKDISECPHDEEGSRVEVAEGMFLPIGLDNQRNFSEDEFPHVANAIMVCLRSIIYANCDATYLDLNVSRSSLGSGKPNIKGRPKGTTHKIIYVPLQVNRYSDDGDSPISRNESEGKRAWLGKLPYTRKFKHDRYEKSGLQGQTKRYPMCLGRNGENPLEREMTKYVVRKPKTPFKIKS